MEFPAVFPWQALPSVASARYAPYDKATIVEAARERDLCPTITDHFATAVLQRIENVSIEFEGHLTKAQAITVARQCVSQECVHFDMAYLGKKVAEASKVQRDLILGIIEEAIEDSELRGPGRREIDRAEDEIRGASSGSAGDGWAVSEQEEPQPQVKAVEIVKNGRRQTRFVFSQAILDKHFNGRDPYNADIATTTTQLSSLDFDETRRSSSTIADLNNGKDILTALSSSVELAVELGKYLSAVDIMNLYIASSTFRRTINNYMLSSVRIWLKNHCPEAQRVFPFTMYKKHLIPDPTGRTWGQVYASHAPASLTAEKRDKVRTIPGMKYLQLVMGRDKIVREILAILAREGHLMPKGMYNTLLRMWLLMDITTTRHRMALLSNKKLWSDQDLYNGQLFFVKLTMHTNDPVYGPASVELMQLFMGQKTLYSLWQLLFRKHFTGLRELLELKLRYNYELAPAQWQRCISGDKTFNGVPMGELGILHREGYGTIEGNHNHLMRPDELIPQEACARGLQLEKHIRHMILWGYFNHETGENIVPTEEELYLSDEEDKLENMEHVHHWRKRHARKKRWDTLTPCQKRDIVEADEDETLRCQAWGYWGEEDENRSELNAYDSDSDSAYSLDDEIRRGVCVPEESKHKTPEVPDQQDKQSWVAFANKVLMGAPPKLDMEWMQRLQVDNEVTDPRFDERFDWRGWMNSEGFKLEDFVVFGEDKKDGAGDVRMA